MRGLGLLVGSDLIAGVVISLVALFVALVLLYRLVALELDAELARITVMLVAFCPMAYFLSAVYSESLFLSLAVGCIWFARTGRWGWAGLLGGLAAAERATGITLVVPFALLYLYGPRVDRAPAFPLVSRPWLRRLLPRYRPGQALAWVLSGSGRARRLRAGACAQHRQRPLAISCHRDHVVQALRVIRGSVGWRGRRLGRPQAAGPRTRPSDVLQRIRRKRAVGRGREPDAVRVSRARRDRAGRNISATSRRVRRLVPGRGRASPFLPGEPAAAAVDPALRDGAVPAVHVGALVDPQAALDVPAVAGFAVLLGLFTAEFATWRFVA